MLKIVIYISFGFALLFALLLLLSLLRRTHKKSLKVRKKIKARRHLYGVAAGIFLLAGLTLQMIRTQPVELKALDTDASPVDAYQKAGSGVEALPQSIFALGDDYYVRTGKGAVYGYLQIAETVTDEDGKETETVKYEKGLALKAAQLVTGDEAIRAVLTKNGRLQVSGAFEYLTYEKDRTTFEKKVYANNCTFAEGNSNTLFYVEDGDLYSVGYNAFGQLGDGTVRNRLESAMILQNAASASVSDTHTLAVDVYGNLYGFGDNSYSEMGNRTTSQSTTPIKLMSGVKQAEAGTYFSIVLTKNGEVYAAGRNDRGQLGTGDRRDYATYKKILDGVSKIAVNGSSCAALTANGTLYAWGSNIHHQLGSGEEIIDAPKKIAEDVYDVAMGATSMGLLRLDRDVTVTGSARPENNNEFMQSIWQFDAEVPAEQLYRETVEMPARPE